MLRRRGFIVSGSHSEVSDDEVLERIDASLSSSMDSFVRLYREIDGSAVDLASVGHALYAAGGKRLRAQLFYWGWRAAAGPDCAEVIDLAVAFEILHLFALV